jgi:D-psicose/D-tagatose/L-ribulose 3-epimerase
MNPLGINLWNWIPRLEDAEPSLIRRIAALGFTAVELPLTGSPGANFAELMKAAEAEKLEVSFCAAMPPERDMSSDDAGTRKKALAYLEDCFRAGEQYGVRLISGALYGSTGKRHFLSGGDKKREWDYAVGGIRRAAKAAGEAGMTLGIEPINRYRTSMVNTVEQALSLLEDINMDNLGILFDTFQANIEETCMVTALEETLKRGRLVHFHASENNRGAPGTGHIPWQSLAAILKQYNYSGHITMESFCPQAPDPSFYPLAETQDILAKTGIENMRRIFSPG